MPFAVGVDSIHPSLSVGNPAVVTRDSAYWSFRVLFNLMKMKYGPFMGKLDAVRAPLEANGIALVRTLDGTPIANNTAAYANFTNTVVTSMWALPDQILAVWYDDGEQYPEWWLESVGYENGPPPPPHSGNTGV
jgi:hypothetical protein